MPHTEQQRLPRCDSADGEYKSYGGTMNSPSSHSGPCCSAAGLFTKNGKKVGLLSTHLSALDVTLEEVPPWT